MTEPTPLPRAAKGTGLIVRDDQLSYTSVQGSSEYLSVARGYSELPRINNPEVSSNAQMATALRLRMKTTVVSALLKDPTVTSAYNSLSTSLTVEMDLFRQRLTNAVSSQLRRDYTLLKREGFVVDTSEQAHNSRLMSAMGRIKSEMQYTSARASNLYNKTFAQVSERLKADNPNIQKIVRYIAPQTFERVNHHSLSRGMSALQRTSLQRARMSAQATLYAEAGVEFVYWRLSSAHKDYGGSEVCEILAASTGNIASRTRNEKGVYTLREAPQAPHPNCMCCLVPTK